MCVCRYVCVYVCVCNYKYMYACKCVYVCLNGFALTAMAGLQILCIKNNIYDQSVTMRLQNSEGSPGPSVPGSEAYVHKTCNSRPPHAHKS